MTEEELAERKAIENICDEFIRIRKIVMDIHDFGYEEITTLTSIILTWKLAGSIRRLEHEKEPRPR